MHLSNSKHRILVSQILLGFYLLGALQATVLELFHFISHSVISHEHAGTHSYADHAYSDAHAILEVLNTGSENDNEQQRTIVKSFDKVEFINQPEISVNVLNESSRIVINIPQIQSIIKLDIPSPPPEQGA